jgi:hypothetical protein
MPLPTTAIRDLRGQAEGDTHTDEAPHEQALSADIPPPPEPAGALMQHPDQAVISQPGAYMCRRELVLSAASGREPQSGSGESLGQSTDGCLEQTAGRW